MIATGDVPKNETTGENQCFQGLNKEVALMSYMQGSSRFDGYGCLDDWYESPLYEEDEWQ